MRTTAALIAIIALTLLRGGDTLVAVAQAPPAPTVEELGARVNALVPQLDHEDFRVRRQAALLLKNLPGDAWPALKAAMSRKGLSIEARSHLDAAARILQARSLNETRYNDLAWNRESAVAAYDLAGRHSPKWDASAREALRLYPRPAFNAKLTPKQDDARRAAFENAINAGCDDPLVQYCYARVLDEDPDGTGRTPANRLYRSSAEAIGESAYPAIRKCFALARFASMAPGTDESEEAGKKVIELLPVAAKEPGVRPSHLLALARMTVDARGTAPGGQRAAYNTLQAILDAALPGKVEPLLFKGEYLAKLAYEDPPDPAPIPQGLQPPDPPPPDPATEALRKAHKALVDAWTMDNTDGRAPTLMIGLRLLTLDMGGGDVDGDGGADEDPRSRMDQWFRRAMDANPDNYDACLKKLDFLATNSSSGLGSPSDLLRFGRECAAGGNYYGRIPFVLVEAHARAAQDEPDRNAYLARDEVWQEIRKVYEQYLKLFPDHDWHRSGYAKWAVECGRWHEAKALFDSIGDKPDLRIFGSEDSFAYFRGLADAALKQDAAKNLPAKQ